MTSTDILIVDDNPANSKLVSFLLSTRGYAVRTAASAGEALVELERALPALILMDIQLPGMDGLALTRQLRADARTARIPIIALTAYAMKGDEDRALQAGCDVYITKPIDTRTLPGQVADLLAQRGRG